MSRANFKKIPDPEYSGYQTLNTKYMLDQKQFALAINQIAEEKGIPKEEIIKVIEAALAAAYKKDYGKKGQIIRVNFNSETGAIKVFQVKQVVPDDIEEFKEGEEAGKIEAEKTEIIYGESNRTIKPPETAEGTNQLLGGEKPKLRYNPEKHIKLSEAKKEKPDAKVDDEIERELPPQSDFGRIASQTAKQVITQRIREIERAMIYDKFKKNEGEVMIGTVQRIEFLPSQQGKVVLVDINRVMGIIPPPEQIPRENYRTGQRIKVYVVNVRETPKGPEILLSRSHSELLKKLFALEVPEISNGLVEIKAISRDPGERTKIAVSSNDANIDPIGACVGQKGTRVHAIIEELGGEKIDVIEWNKDLAKFVKNAMSPAKVLEVNLDEKNSFASVKVAEDQLSLAIGRHGQNVRLASKLTGLRIDVVGKKAEEVKPPEGKEAAKPEGEKEKAGDSEVAKKSEGQIKEKAKKTKKEKKVKAKKENSAASVETKEEKK